jgi:hypothetical protein
LKLVQVRLHFEYTDAIEEVLDRHGLQHWVRHPRIEGRDGEGKHTGSQAFPGSVSVVEVRVDDDRLAALLDELRSFRDAKAAHGHLEALVLPIEQTL